MSQQTLNPQAAPYKPSLKQKLLTPENIWRSVFIVVSIAFAGLFKHIVDFRTDSQRAVYGSTLHILYSLPLLIVMHLTKTWTINTFSVKFEGLLNPIKYALADKRTQKGVLLSKWVYDIFYYLLLSIAGTLVMMKHESFPEIDWNGIRANNVLTQIVPKDLELQMESLYLIQFNHHLYALLSHIFSKNVYGKSKFYEFALHHGMAVFLIFYSYMFNIWAVGLLVLIFHDISDAFLIAGRTYLDMKFKSDKVLPFVLVTGMFVWISTRLILFPICCIYPLIVAPYTPEIAYMCAMEIGLLVMHVYWTYQLFKTMSSRNRTDY